MTHVIQADFKDAKDAIDNYVYVPMGLSVFPGDFAPPRGRFTFLSSDGQIGQRQPAISSSITATNQAGTSLPGRDLKS